MKSVFKWVLGKALLYVLLVLALTIGTLALPKVLDQVGHDGLAREMMSPKALADQFARDRNAAIAKAEQLHAEIARAPTAEVTEMLASARAEREALNEQLQAPQGFLASVSPREVLSRKNLELQLAVVDGEIILLEAAKSRNTQAEVLQTLQSAPAQPLEAAVRACDQAQRELKSFQSRLELDQVARNLVFRDEERLQKAANDNCRRSQEVLKAQNAAITQVQQAKDALATADAAYLDASERAKAPITDVTLNLTRTLSSILVTAAFLVAGILATPLLIRFVLYFILAPLAQRRPPIDLRPGAEASYPSLIQASATSVPVTLEVDEELLVRQGFLQSTSTKGHKRTRALLDWRHPLSSLASGLSFLTRIVGEGETTTISAVRDPLAEVAVLELTHRGACVLHPRALVAVVKKTDRRLRITSHWRLFSLHAWLTLQLRYLMFHGPCLLVLKGGRGIRVERAESGRLFGQDQLVGFSPDLAYTVARTETFWPYFLGREALFKDRVDAGGGVLIVEEAPMGSGRGGPRRGLEGALDVVLKAVGL